MGIHSKWFISLYFLIFAFGSMHSETPVSVKLLDGVSLLGSYNGIQNRNLEIWKRDISAYSLRHYGFPGAEIKPTAIILHYTATNDFPINLISSETYNGEVPGVASHFVIQQTGSNVAIYQLLPLDVMSRATFGANFCSISIEMVALNEKDLLAKKELLAVAVRVVSELMVKYEIKPDHIFGHEEIDSMLAENPHGVFYDNTIEGVFVPRKKDPGKNVMEYFRKEIARAMQIKP